MTANEIKFMDFWEKNLRGKADVLTQHITEAHFYLYGVPYTGSACGSCMGRYAQELKKVYESLLQQKGVSSLEDELSICPVKPGDEYLQFKSNQDVMKEILEQGDKWWSNEDTKTKKKTPVKKTGKK